MSRRPGGEEEKEKSRRRSSTNNCKDRSNLKPLAMGRVGADVMESGDEISAVEPATLLGEAIAVQLGLSCALMEGDVNVMCVGGPETPPSTVGVVVAFKPGDSIGSGAVAAVAVCIDTDEILAGVVRLNMFVRGVAKAAAAGDGADMGWCPPPPPLALAVAVAVAVARTTGLAGVAVVFDGADDRGTAPVELHCNSAAPVGEGGDSGNRRRGGGGGR